MTKKARINLKKEPRRLCSRVRAVFDADKESRFQDFINSASRLFERLDYAAISVADICFESGLAKGTFYLYFDTKEEAFLALTRQEISKWVAALNEKLLALDLNPPATSFALVLASSFRPVPQLPRLLQLLHSILERNVSEDSIVNFKTEVAASLDMQAEIVSKLYPQLVVAQIQSLMLFCQVLLSGVWQIANPPASVRKILERNGMQRFLIEFELAVVGQAVTFMHGLGLRG